MNHKNSFAVVSCAWLLSATLLVGLCAASPNLIANGDFEILPIGTPPGDLAVLLGGSQALPGWIVTGNSIDHVKNYYWQNASGASSVDLDGYFATGGLYQSFATEIGKTYRLTFARAGNPDPSDEPLKKLQVTIAAVSKQYTVDVTKKTHDNMGWVNESLDFLATSAHSTLQFTSIDTGTHGRGPAVDNIAVSLVPEPSAALLCSGSAAFAALAAFPYRRRK